MPISREEALEIRSNNRRKTIDGTVTNWARIIDERVSKEFGLHRPDQTSMSIGIIQNETILPEQDVQDGLRKLYPDWDVEFIVNNGWICANLTLRGIKEKT